MVESCWARESSGLTGACFGFYGLKLMPGDNLVPLRLHLGYSQTILCQFL